MTICIAKETIEGLNTDQNQLLEKVQQKSKSEEAEPKDEYDIALVDISTENTNPKHGKVKGQILVLVLTSK